MKQTFSNGKLLIEVDPENPLEMRKKMIQDSKPLKNWTKAELLGLLKEINNEQQLGLEL